MSIKQILVAITVVLTMVSCEALKQLGQQNQQGGGNQGGNIQLDGPVECNLQGRYTKPVFPAGKIKIFKDIPYATMTAADQWNGGRNTNICYGELPYKYQAANGKEELRLDVYMPDPAIDKCRSRSLILMVHPGGFAPVGTPNKTHQSVPGRAKYLAQMGYVVAAIDYRKGFDFKTNTYHPKSIAALVIPNQTINCSEQQKPDAESFQKALFRFIQDIRASHRFLHENKDLIGTDNNKIFYLGMSTGAIGITHAAYAADEAAYWNRFGLGSVESFGPNPELETQIKVAGVIAEQPALHKVEWIEASDNIPIYMMHGAIDYDVPFEHGYLAGLTSYNGSTKVEDMGPFALHGGKALYDQLKTLGGNTRTKGHLLAFDGVSHHLTPMTTGQCQKLKGAFKGAWIDAYNFANEIIKEVDTGVPANIKTGYCFYKNATQGNCTPVCE